MEILITGTSGFVGTNLIHYFEKREINEIVKINLRTSNWKSKINEEATAIIHLAGKAHDIKKSAHPETYFEVNTKLTQELFDVFLVSNCQDFIYFSSTKAVANTTEKTITETTAPNPQTPYGQSKFQAEQYLLSQPLPSGKRLFILRPCMIHGPGNKGNLNFLYQIVAKRIPWPLGAFENQRSFCSIENVCFVINEILENESIPSGIYNLADDEAIPTNRLIALIAAAQYKKSRIFKISKGLISCIAKIGDVLKLPLNSERLQKLTESYVVSNEKIVKAIGKLLPVKTEEGLLKTLKSFKK
jgi:nucleoside-diphosphate-sugar epimerase